MRSLIDKYFPSLTSQQKEQFDALSKLYTFWNNKVNVISKKDIANLYERHVLHSLAIAKFHQFQANTNVLDIGCGGGFPGIPLAILFPDVNIHMVDAVAKKINVAFTIAAELGLKNATATHARVEELGGQYDMVVSRAVADAVVVWNWAKPKLHAPSTSSSILPPGLIVLKGGALQNELDQVQHLIKSNVQLSQYFEEEFFLDKRVIYFSEN